MSSGIANTGAERDARAVAGWLAARFGVPVDLAERPSSKGEGFDSVIHLVRFGGEALPDEWGSPLVVRVKADASRAQEAHEEAAVQGWLADRGYPAPRVLAVFGAGEVLDLPAQVMERAPGRLLVDHVREAPWRTRAALDHMAGLHVRLHELSSDGFPGDADLLEQRLRLARLVVDRLDDDALATALARIESLAPSLRDAPSSVCHGDFHPLNIMTDRASGGGGFRSMVIDWTDAGLGDRHGDVARTLVLFGVASIAASNRAEKGVLRAVGPILRRSYRRSYERLAPLDDRRLALWTPVHLLHGWAQARALHAGLFSDQGSPTTANDRTERVPLAMVGELQRRFERAWAAL